MGGDFLSLFTIIRIMLQTLPLNIPHLVKEHICFIAMSIIQKRATVATVNIIMSSI